MTTAAISFSNNQSSGDEQLAGAPPLAINVLVDGSGSVRRRPGISAWSGQTAIAETSQVDGIGAFKGDVYYVNAARRIRKIAIASATDTAVSTTADINTYLAGAGRPVFTETKYRLVIAGGSVPQKVDTGAALSARLGGSPPPSTQMLMLASRLFSNDKTNSATIGQIRFSTVGSTGEELWDPLNFGEAEARPDDIVAMRDNANEMFAFGETTLQVFSPDPVSIAVPGRTRNLGCSAAHGVVRLDDNFLWLDNQRRFVISDGRSYTEIGGPISRTLDSITTVSDCYGFRFNLDQFDAVVWVFPTDGRAFAWQRDGGWSQWHGWTENQGYTALPVKSHFFEETTNTHLVGLSTGQIGQFDTGASTDVGGGTIKAEVTTGFLNRGTDAFKSCETLRLTLKRGQTTGTAPVVRISWRDDLGAFCSPISISLGTAGDYAVTKELRSLGTYRRRQWKFEMTDAAELVLAGVEEVYSAGGDA